MLDEKEETRKKKKKNNNNNETEIFTFDFLDCEEKSWDSEAVFDIRIAQDFHL